MRRVMAASLALPLSMSMSMSMLTLLSLSGCAMLAGTPEVAQQGIDGVACVGEAAAGGPGLIESSNPALIARAAAATGAGGVCAAKVFSVSAPVVVYRVFDAAHPRSKFGSWWSLARPSGPRDDYRATYAICPEWSALDRVVACELRPGSQVVIGTTQSAVCADGSAFAKTAANQVFIANDGRAGIVHVGACSEDAEWP